MTAAESRRPITSRQDILRAAGHQFAHRPYHQVGLNEVLAEAAMTKSAMYVYFRSKQALATAIIDDQATKYVEAAQGLLAGKVPGLQALVDVAHLVAVADIRDDIARAGLNLLESVGEMQSLKRKLLEQWIQLLGQIVERAIAEGDVSQEGSPRDIGRLLVSLYMGMRQTSNLDKPEQFLLDVEKNFAMVLPGIVRVDRLDYFRQFIRRRTALAIEAISAPPVSVDRDHSGIRS